MKGRIGLLHPSLHFEPWTFLAHPWVTRRNGNGAKANSFAQMLCGNISIKVWDLGERNLAHILRCAAIAEGPHQNDANQKYKNSAEPK